MRTIDWVWIVLMVAAILVAISFRLLVSRRRAKAEELLTLATAAEAEGKYSQAVQLYCDALTFAIEAPEVEQRLLRQLTPLYQRHLPIEVYSRTQQLLDDLQKLTGAYQVLLTKRMEGDNLKRVQENQLLKRQLITRLPQIW